MEYRPAVSAILFQDDKFAVTNSQGWDPDIFCFPQGGVEDGESDREALRRELTEELQTTSFDIICQSKYTHSYEFDDRTRDGYSGQRQTIWFVEFTGTREEIDVPNNEIQNIEWVDREQVIQKLAFEEQRDTYESALDEWDKEFQRIR